MKNIIFILLLVLSFIEGRAQGSFEEFKSKLNSEYSAFKSAHEQDFENFRKRINEEYAALLEKSWREFNALKGVPIPEEDELVPPVVYPEEDKDENLEDRPLPFDEVIPVVEPDPQPTPITPIEEKPEPMDTWFDFTFFNTKLKVRLDNKGQFVLQRCEERDIAKVWSYLASGVYDNTLYDCLEIRSRYELCDWAYLLMLNELSQSCFKGRHNEAVLLTAFLYCQSGYKMRLASAGEQLFLLYASKHMIYDKPYWTIDGEMFYPFNCTLEQLYICDAAFPEEKPLSLQIQTEQKFGVKSSAVRKLQSEKYGDMKANVVTNENLLAFLNSYPTSIINNDFGTRWAMYANTPLSNQAKSTLYPSLQKAIQGKGQLEAVNRLLNFVQTAFVYEYDDKVWGYDRAFFADETLYYPYCDCEDRSILFSRLVRDLLELEVVLIYYPGHLATAVHFDDVVTGDYVTINGKRYVICDPTYIGAPVGATMPKMDNTKAKIILLS